MEAANLQTAEGSAVVTEASIIDRILEAHGHIAPPKGSFTARDYVARARESGVTISEPSALRALLLDAAEGKLQKRKFTVGGRERWYFW